MVDLGSALGIVSLGITLCQEIVVYLKACRSYSSDVRGTESSISDIMLLLTNLKSVLESRDPKAPNQVLFQQVGESATRCEGSLGELEKQFTKMKPFVDQPVDAEQAEAKRKDAEPFRNKRRRLTYQFKRDTLADLQKQVEATRKSLSELMSVLMIRQNMDTHEALDRHQQAIEKLDRRQVDAEILQWLAAPDPSTNLRHALEQRLDGTGKWLLESSEFLEWNTRPSSFLWLQGFAGSGKSILCSSVINELLTQSTSSSGTAVCYYYFDYKNSVKTKTESMLKSIIKQLALQSETASQRLREFHSTYRSSSPPSFEYIELIRAAAADLTSFCIVIDALDECQEHKTLSSFLNRVRAWNCEALHVLVTSRAEPSLTREIHYKEVETMVIKCSKQDTDIEKYVAQRLATDQRLKRWSLLRDTIKIELSQKAEGMSVLPPPRISILLTMVKVSLG